MLFFKRAWSGQLAPARTPLPETEVTFSIVLLALVAAFLGLRLYSVLGKRTGHEQEPVVRTVEERLPATIAQPRTTPERQGDTGPVPVGAVARDAQRGVQAVIQADRGFDVLRFVEGAKSAYRMVLEAFWKGDREELAFLCDADVLAEFAGAIDAREAEGIVVENRLIRIDEARIVAAEMEGRIARITIRFDADIAALEKDKDGNVIGGSMTDAVETHDVWTFARDTRSADPDWRLVETDAA